VTLTDFAALADSVVLAGSATLAGPAVPVDPDSLAVAVVGSPEELPTTAVVPFEGSMAVHRALVRSSFYFD